MFTVLLHLFPYNLTWIQLLDVILPTICFDLAYGHIYRSIIIALCSKTCFKSKSIEWTGMFSCGAKPFVGLYDKDLTCRLAESIALPTNHNITNSTLYLFKWSINICIKVPQSQIPLTCPGSGVDRHGNTSTSTNWGWTLKTTYSCRWKIDLPVSVGAFSTW